MTGIKVKNLCFFCNNSVIDFYPWIPHFRLSPCIPQVRLAINNVHILSIIIRKVEKPWLGVEADPSWLLGYRPACGSIKMWCTADSCHIRHHRSLLGRIAISVKPNLRRPQPFVSMVGSDFLPWSRLQLQGKLSGRLEQYNEFEFCEKNTLKYASFYLPVVRVWNM